MNPQEMMISIAQSAWFGIPEPIYSPKCNPKPGSAYARLPERIRNILKDLKSSDIANIRPDAIWGKSFCRPVDPVVVFLQRDHG